MSEPAAPDPDPGTTAPPSSSDGTVPPMPYPGATTAQAPSFPDSAVPPMPSEATNAHTRGIRLGQALAQDEAPDPAGCCFTRLLAAALAADQPDPMAPRKPSAGPSGP